MARRPGLAKHPTVPPMFHVKHRVRGPTLVIAARLDFKSYYNK
jgi:hypothetical protein